MTKEELEKATGMELIEQRNYCGVDGYYGNYLLDVNAEMLKRFNRLAELEKKNNELKTIKIPQLERKIASIRGAHSVDCKKLKARTEQVERLKKENSELRKQLAYAKDVVRSLLLTFAYDISEEDLAVDESNLIARAEQFLKEISE